MMVVSGLGVGRDVLKRNEELGGSRWERSRLDLSDGGVSLSEGSVEPSDAERVLFDGRGEREVLLVGRGTVVVVELLLFLVVGSAASNERAMT